MHLYIPVESPPTPAPSPGPTPTNPSRLQYLASILNTCTQSELRFISVSIAPLLKRDFLRDLPMELALHVLRYIDDPCSLVRVGQVSKRWREVVKDESVWRRMCHLYQFPVGGSCEYSAGANENMNGTEPLKDLEEFADKPMDPALEWLRLTKRRSLERISSSGPPSPRFPSSFSHFKYHYITLQNWRYGGHLLREYPAPMPPNVEEGSVITSVALDSEWVVVGSESAMIHIFSARTGVLHRVLVGHTSGVWSVGLVSRGGKRRSCASTMGEGLPDEMASLSMTNREALGLGTVAVGDIGVEDQHLPSHPNGASEGWGQPNAIVVSAGCDQVVRVWDVDSGNCIYTLSGHTATIRCLKVLHHSPTAVTGARDGTLRVWDVQRGKMLRVLEGHTDRVRCLDVFGRKAVSGSYDWTCRVWDINTGECLHVLRGHHHQVYCVAFNGVYIASGGLDTVVRVWSAETGQILSVLTGHTALVCQLQLSSPQRSRAFPRWFDIDRETHATSFPSYPSSSNPSSSSLHDIPYVGSILATGGSDGRVITYDLDSRQVLHRIAAHDAPITALQFDEHFIVSSGSDGRVRVFDTRTGRLVRDWSSADGSRRASSDFAYGLETGSGVSPSLGMRGGNGRYENVWKVVFGGSLWGAPAGGISGDVVKSNYGDGRGRDICAVMCRKPGGRTVMEIWRMSPEVELINGGFS